MACSMFFILFFICNILIFSKATYWQRTASRIPLAPGQRGNRTFGRGAPHKAPPLQPTCPTRVFDGKPMHRRPQSCGSRSGGGLRSGQRGYRTPGHPYRPRDGPKGTSTSGPPPARGGFRRHLDAGSASVIGGITTIDTSPSGTGGEK